MSDFARIFHDLNRAGMKFVLTDLDVALTFLDLAEVSHSEATVRRNHTNARIAHDAIERLLPRLTPDAEQRQLIDAKLAALKTRLRAVGCRPS